MRSDYADWTAAVHTELKSRNIDPSDAYDWFSFKSCYEDYGMTPVASVDDYQDWMQENVDV